MGEHDFDKLADLKGARDDQKPISSSEGQRVHPTLDEAASAIAGCYLNYLAAIESTSCRTRPKTCKDGGAQQAGQNQEEQGLAQESTHNCSSV